VADRKNLIRVMPAKGAAMDTPESADVAIIGGGVIGLSIGWRAAQRGMRVVIADPRPGGGASHAAAGMLTPVAEAQYAEKELFRLGQESLRRYPGFVAELESSTGLPAGFRASGTLQVAYDRDDMAVLEEFAVLRESFGVTARRLTARECRALEPVLHPGISGGLLIDDDASVDPRLLSSALLTAATGAGAAHVPERVAAILARGGRAGGITLGNGTTVTAGWVVLAAGWQSAALDGLPPEAAPPVRPVKGQVIRLRDQSGPLLSRTVRGVVAGSSVYLVPRDSGELVVGATQEEMGPDIRVTAGGVWELLRDARLLVPGITELELAEAVARLRPGTPDNAPVLGPGRMPGLVLATGHFRGGVLLAPVTAEVITEFLATGRVPEIAAPFAADRFTGAEAT
jgi:glycine oxidase